MRSSEVASSLRGIPNPKCQFGMPIPNPNSNIVPTCGFVRVMMSDLLSKLQLNRCLTSLNNHWIKSVMNSRDTNDMVKEYAYKDFVFAQILKNPMEMIAELLEKGTSPQPGTTTLSSSSSTKPPAALKIERLDGNFLTDSALFNTNPDSCTLYWPNKCNGRYVDVVIRRVTSDQIEEKCNPLRLIVNRWISIRCFNQTTSMITKDTFIQMIKRFTPPEITAVITDRTGTPAWLHQVIKSVGYIK